ncbi:MAG: LuxR C-terminal-related transcriptional regulator [Anaerolineales bacterium]|jgi:LuxR family maltose regulon positive regulatory protein|nr:LuxR C-terminal-related transcriptional regulator [Anaerolineales bacterium]
MPAPILATKLYIPLPRSSMVRRPRLVKHLIECLDTGCRLTLISAPAGFGKTTLVSEWIAECGRPVAWLSLDEGDGDPARFISYLVAALQTIQAGIGEGWLAALQSPQPLQIETILTTLLNEISAIPGNFLLVLDDYHSIDSPPVDQSLAFLIEHQPPQMHLLITTREDPSLPLARLRARGQCTELRAADLRFTPAETVEFLNRIMGLALSEEDIAALEARTEGWIAGLQMAAISMKGLTDRAGFIQSFTGSHRFVLDYLLEEVLHRQPAEIQTFLLRTSILERLCGSLCDTVLEASPGSGDVTLQTIERANLFISPLDNERRWYRYHHLFADLLRKRLGQSLTVEEIAELHVKVCGWYEKNDLLLDAFSHAAAANDIERAVRLMEDPKMPLHRRGTATAILGWLKALPDPVRNARPALWWMQAALMLTIGQTVGVEEILQAAEKALGLVISSNTDLDETTRDLIGKIAVIRANLAQAEVQTEMIFIQARRALEYLHPGNSLYRSSATRTMGFAYYWLDDLDRANQAFTEALSLAQTAGDIPSIMLALIRLGQLQEDHNQLYQAAETYQRALNLLDEYTNPNAATAYLGLAEIFYQWNNLDAAEQYAEQGLQLAQQYDQITDRIIMSELHLALIKLARRDLNGAAQMVSQAEQASQRKNFTLRLPNIAFFKTWLYLHQGDINAAAQLVSQHEIPLMRARVFIRRDESIAALEVLEQLRHQAETKGLARRLLDVKTVQAVALYAQGESDTAVELLGEVMAEAESGGFIRLFLDEGAPMMQLLSIAAAQGIRPAYVTKLLAAFDAEPKGEQPSAPVAGSTSLIEPLSPRELEVLGLIALGLSNQEICKRLFLALDTVKGHNRRIFEKLQVKRRTEAVVRARELGLI